MCTSDYSKARGYKGSLKTSYVHIRKPDVRHISINYIPGHGDLIWKDGVTGFLFRAAYNQLLRAETHILERLNDGDIVLIHDLYEFVKIDYESPISYMFGWSPHTRAPNIIIDAEFVSGAKPIGHIRYNACLMNPKGYPVNNGRIFLEKLKAPQ